MTGLTEQQLNEIRAAAVRAVERHPSTTFMAPCESLADAVLDAVLPALLARVTELEQRLVPLPDYRLHSIRARLAEVRPGPWEVADALEGDGFPGHLWVVRTPGDVPGDEVVVVSIGDRAVAEFIAAARQDVPLLLDHVRVLETVLAAAEGAEARVSELEAAAAGDLTIYRASHDSIVIGHYTTAAVAREHCETYARREHHGTAELRLWWREDEDTVDQPEEGPAELIEHIGAGPVTPTGYLVIPVTAAAAYDADGDE